MNQAGLQDLENWDFQTSQGRNSRLSFLKDKDKLTSDMWPTKNKNKKIKECALHVRICFLNDYLCKHNIHSNGLVQVPEEKERKMSKYIYWKKMTLILIKESFLEENVTLES